MSGWRRLLVADAKLYLREPTAVFFTLVFPALVLAFGGYSFGQEEVLTTESGLTLRVVDLMLPATLAWVVASQGLMGTYPVLTSLRETKVLKYYRTHPLHAGHILLSQYLNGLFMLTLSMLVLGLVGQALFRLRADAHLVAFAAALLLAYSAFFALGFALAAVTPTARAAQALGSVIFFPLMFVSGSFGPRQGLPPALKALSDLSPLTHATELLTTLWLQGSQPLAQVLRTPWATFGVDLLGRRWFDHTTPGHSAGYLAALTVLAAAVALRTFRWDEEDARAPRRAPAPAEPFPQDATVWAQGLRKVYDTTPAVDGLNLHIRPGEIFGLLGPNGAGKTTTVEMLEGLRAPTQGTARVLGLDPWADRDDLVRRTGVQLQEAALPARLTVREILHLFAGFYPRSLDPEALLIRLDLRAQADQFFGRLSGGQKQRVFAALALINDPEVVFVDEITTGLDPAARRRVWGFLRELRQAGKTIVLTTHYLEEAQALCDRVLMLRQGRVVAQGRPEDLIADLDARFRLEVETETPVPPAVWQAVPAVAFGQWQDGSLTLYLRDEAGLEAVLAELRRAGIPFRHLRWQPVSLEDVFLMLTQQHSTRQEVLA